MPVVYRCKHCGFILHVFVKVGQSSYGVPTPSELISIYGGACPRCGHRLEPPTLNDIVVKPDGPEELLAVLEEARRTMGIRFASIEKYLDELRLRVARRRATVPTAPGLVGAGPSVVTAEA